MSEYDAVVSDGQEADDLIAIAAADLDYNCTTNPDRRLSRQHHWPL
jgi:hypothetical protein